MKEAFYRTLAAGAGQGQVIIFENDDPPADLKDRICWQYFTKSRTGRYDFSRPRSSRPHVERYRTEVA